MDTVVVAVVRNHHCKNIHYHRCHNSFVVVEVEKKQTRVRVREEVVVEEEVVVRWQVVVVVKALVAMLAHKMIRTDCTVLAMIHCIDR